MPEQTPSLGQKTIRGATWAGAARVGQQAVQTISTAALARLLSPEIYGVMAMANLVVNLLQQLTDVGTGAALIQKEVISERFKSSIFWLNLLIGLVLGVAVLVLAPLVAAFYKEPRVTAVMAVLSVTFLLASVAVVPQSLLIREMDYKRIAVIEISASAVGAGGAIGLAWRGFGVWSFVGGAILSGLATAILSFLLTGWKPRLEISREDLRSTMSFSLNLTGFVIVNYFSRNAGHFLIGRFLGPVALGFYQMSFTVMIYPLQSIGGILGRVMFPAFAKLQNDHARFRDGYSRAVAVIGALTIPIMLGMMVVAGDLIRVFLGTKWAMVAPLLVLFAPIGALQSVVAPIGQIFMAKGRTDVMLKLGIFSALVQISGYIAGMPWGVEGVIIAYGVANVIIAVPGFIIPLRLIEMRARELLGVLAPIAGISIGMAVVAYGGRELMRCFTDVPVIVLSWTVSLGAAAYLLLLVWARVPVLRDLARPFANSEVILIRRMAERLTT